ncbi:MAG: hypothetical protein H8D63_02280 [Parcubacteria group bacterium]|nr:hypothetical protein [Parcubacteria group bacterium]
MSHYRSTLIHTRAERNVSEEVQTLLRTCVSYEDRMKKATTSDMSIPESVIAFPSYADAQELAKQFRKQRMKVCVVVGTGGSILGTKAVYEALRGHADTELLCVESADPERVQLVVGRLLECERIEDVVCVVVSKSGQTLETMVALRVIHDTLRQCFGDACDTRMVAITDADSVLAGEAKKKDWHTLFIPRHIGGRFSVLTPVGIFPLACVGINTDTLLEGARGAVELWREEETVSEVSVYAAELYGAYQSGTRVLSLFMFDARLHAFGVWYQALLAESVGKDGKGFLPIVMKGSEDLHALGQYLYDGPDIATTHVFSASRDADIIISSGEYSGTVLGDMHDAIQDAFVDTYRAKGKSCIETHIPGGITPEAIGELLGEQMIMIMILGHLFDVNTFNQPGVEAYKEKAREIMAQP